MAWCRRDKRSHRDCPCTLGSLALGGVWRIDGVAFYTKYQKVRQGQVNCYPVVGLSDDSVVVGLPNGGTSESKLQKGNPLGL